MICIQPLRMRRLLAPLLASALLAGCVEPPQRSAISEAIDNVSFAPPPGATPLPAETGFLPGGPTPAQPPLARAQVYPAREQPLRSGDVGAAAVERSVDGVQLNFDRADVREVAKVILGQILGVSYTIDPNVSGEVTLASSGPIAERDLLPVLESILRANGASLVSVEAGTYQIVPAEAAIGRSEVVPLGGRPIRVRPGFGVTIVPLRNISSTAAAQFIQPLVSAPEDIRIDPARNTILFSGTSNERQNVVDTLADLDVDWMAGRSVGLFPLRLGTPEAIIPELQTIFTPFDPSGAELPSIRFVPVARLNAVLAVGSDPDQIAEVERWVTRLDQGKTVGTQFYVYRLKHAAAEDIAKLLNETFGDASPSTSAGPTLASASTALGAVSAPVAEPDVDDGGGISPDLPGSAPASVSTGSTATGPVKIVANKSNNALLIRATPQIYEQIEATLQRLDTAPLQVLIEATIAEVLLNDRLRYGVQYFLEGNNFAFGFKRPPPADAARVTLEPLPQVPGFNFLFTGRSVNITIDALSSISNVKVLSSPSVVVQDNSEAELSVGQEVPITTRQAVSVESGDPLAPTLNSIEYRETGVILQVRPRINVNGVVSLEIAQEVSRVPTTAAGNDLTPVITQRKVTSRINVQSGQTVVLGGLIQEEEDRGRSRVPVLGEIPVIGNLFGTTDFSSGRTELIIFLTPRVIRNTEDARDVSEEIRSRLKALRPARAFVAPPIPNVPPAPDSLPPAPAPLPPIPGPQPLPIPRAALPSQGAAPSAVVGRHLPSQAGRERGFDLARAPLPRPRPAAAGPAAPRPRPMLPVLLASSAR